jgi:hypothetical protein
MAEHPLCLGIANEPALPLTEIEKNGKENVNY